jgi:hypothetical protein
MINERIQAQMSSTLKKYYSCINSAELSIVDSNYIKAGKYYDSAFVQKSSPFAVDLYNASVCAAKLKQNETCYLLLTKLIDKGYKINCLPKQGVFNDLFKTQWGEKLIDYAKHVRIKYNIKLRKTLDSMYNTYQSFLDKVYYREKPYSYYADTIKKTGESNIVSLYKFIDKYGFPSEDLIGIDSSLTKQQYWFIIWNQTKNYNKFNFTKILTKALEEGKIETHTANDLIVQNFGHDLYHSQAGGLVKYIYNPFDDGNYYKSKMNTDRISWGYYSISEQEEKEYNQERQKIGLESISEFRVKQLFCIRNKEFYFSKSSAGRQIFWESDKKSYDEDMKNVILIK